MKKLLFGILILTMGLVFPIISRAEIGVGINISLPVPIVFAAPPELIVLPETNVYVVPDVDEEIFFYNGWWWRPWEGRWYRSRDYSSGWVYYRHAPSFYTQVPSGWRNDYREHRWRGQQWDYQRMPHQHVQQNWRGWKRSNYWEKQHSWGVEGLQPQRRSPQHREVAPQPREAVEPQHRQAAPQPREAVEPQHRQVAPPSREGVKRQHQQVAPPSREAVEPQHRQAAPQSREADKQQHRQAAPQSREADKQQHRQVAPQSKEGQSQQHQKKNKKGEEEKKD